MTSTSPRVRLVDDWGGYAATMQHADASDVDVDAGGRVFVLTRRPACVMVFEPDGALIRSFGSEVISRLPHGLSVGPDGTVYVVDQGHHAVHRFDRDGSHVGTIGIPGNPSKTGVDWTVVKSNADLFRQMPDIVGGPPFNAPTSLAVGPDGDLFVTDGYGNVRVHRFSSDGELLTSWGEGGSGPGQFRTLHGIYISDDDKIYISDRENDRVQVFSLDGRYLDEWHAVRRPTAVTRGPDGFFYVSRLAQARGHLCFRTGPAREATRGCVMVLDEKGRVQARLGADGEPTDPGNFVAPHGIAMDPSSVMYVAEVTGVAYDQPDDMLAGEVEDLRATRDECHRFQKFVVG